MESLACGILDTCSARVHAQHCAPSQSHSKEGPALLEAVGETGWPTRPPPAPSPRALVKRTKRGAPQDGSRLRLDTDPEATEVLPSVLTSQQQNRSFAQTRSPASTQILAAKSPPSSPPRILLLLLLKKERFGHPFPTCLRCSLHRTALELQRSD